MTQSFDMAWPCCETCKHWGGCRLMTNLGLAEQGSLPYRYSDCLVLTGNNDICLATCDRYEQWQMPQPG